MNHPIERWDDFNLESQILLAESGLSHRQLGEQPNRSARSVRKGRTRLINADA